MAEIAFELRPFLNEQGQLISLPAKNKKKLLAIWYLAERIPARRTFTEAEINDAIDDQTTFRDHATLRRELYNHHLLDRADADKASRRRGEARMAGGAAAGGTCVLQAARERLRLSRICPAGDRVGPGAGRELPLSLLPLGAGRAEGAGLWPGADGALHCRRTG